MNASVRLVLSSVLMLGCLAFTATACNTIKATLDTTAKFTSSTSPENLFTSDGLVQEDQKVNLYTAATFENLQQDMARGGGEYLTSLGTLMQVPADRQQEWDASVQSHYADLLPSSGTQAPEMMSRLTRTVSTDPK